MQERPEKSEPEQGLELWSLLFRFSSQPVELAGQLRAVLIMNSLLLSLYAPTWSNGTKREGTLLLIPVSCGMKGSFADLVAHPELISDSFAWSNWGNCWVSPVAPYCQCRFSTLSGEKSICSFLSEPSTFPPNIASQPLNETSYKISWGPLTREKSNGVVLSYEVKYTRVYHVGSQSSSASRYQNTTDSMVTLQGLTLCSTYHVLVRAYTSAGAGPFSSTLEIVTTGRSSNDHVYCTSEKSYERVLSYRCVSLGGTKGAT